MFEKERNSKSNTISLKRYNFLAKVYNIKNLIKHIYKSENFKIFIANLCNDLHNNLL